jgi:hypothetical protein
MDKEYIGIAFTDEQLDRIMRLQEQEELETVQEAVMYAVESSIKK